jgi:hypothetical protein
VCQDGRATCREDNPFAFIEGTQYFIDDGRWLVTDKQRRAQGLFLKAVGKIKGQPKLKGKEEYVFHPVS